MFNALIVLVSGDWESRSGDLGIGGCEPEVLVLFDLFVSLAL